GYGRTLSPWGRGCSSWRTDSVLISWGVRRPDRHPTEPPEPPHCAKGPSMRTTRVAAVSMNGYLGEPERILRAIDGWCEQVAAEGVELALFPELVIHGHCTPNT